MVEWLLGAVVQYLIPSFQSLVKMLICVAVGCNVRAAFEDEDGDWLLGELADVKCAFHFIIGNTCFVRVLPLIAHMCLHFSKQATLFWVY